MLKKELLAKMFGAASIFRWNDYVRPVELTELDKHAHKMIIALLIGKLEEQYNDSYVDWNKLIEGSIFEFLRRTILTDIKRPVFSYLISHAGEHIHQYLYDQFAPYLKTLEGDVLTRFQRYFFDDDYSRNEKVILRAASYLGTKWEFDNVIYELNRNSFGMEKTKSEIDNLLLEYNSSRGIKDLISNPRLGDFIKLCGQLRFQRRWSQSPKVPETSVLGHMYLVAIISYFFSVKVGACSKRLYNNFFSSLFHDLPEALTRDIISPVKNSIGELPDIIKQYEVQEIKRVLMPLLPDAWHNEFQYWVLDEFRNKVLVEEQGELKEKVDVCNADIDKIYNENINSPVDGKILKVFDDLAALMEASSSIRFGITSKSLEEGKLLLLNKYRYKRDLDQPKKDLIDYLFLHRIDEMFDYFE